MFYIQEKGVIMTHVINIDEKERLALEIWATCQTCDDCNECKFTVACEDSDFPNVPSSGFIAGLVMNVLQRSVHQ